MTDFGEILQHIGEFGLFQKILLFVLSVSHLNTCFQLASSIFVESDPERHCNTDWILRADPNLTTDDQLNLTVPREQDGTFSRCRMFVPVDWDINAIRDYGLNETTGCQNGWIYNNTMYDTTIVTDFDLVCERSNFVRLAQTFLMTGFVVGSLVFGPIAESFGRKRAAQVSLLLISIFSVTTAASPNISLYFASQFIIGCGGGGYYISSIILATEWIGVSKRSWGACVTLLVNAVGKCACAGVVYLIRQWRMVQVISAVLVSVPLIFIWFIPESARWLLSRERTEEAKQLILKAAAINKRTIPEFLLNKSAEKAVAHKPGICAIFTSRSLARHFFIIVLAWFSLDLSVFCLHFNMESLGLNIFLTQFLFGAIEVPAHMMCMWLLEVVGRKLSLMATLLTAGLLSILIPAVSYGCGIAITSLAVASRFFLFWGISICNIYIQELFPTYIRQTATGLGATIARIGGMLAPVVNMLAVYQWYLPITVFSSLTLISGAFSFLLPETTHKALPDSTEEAENKRHLTSTNSPSFANKSTRL